MKHTRLILSVAILAAGVVLSYGVFAQDLGPGEPSDEELRAAGITFPIAELGNCASKSECRDFCNDPGNMRACIQFARGHGLMNEAEAARAERFSQRLEVGEGPGECRGPRECDAFCSDITHIEECVAFADEHGFDDPGIEDARRIVAYLRAGGQMPGGCTSEASCRAYCGDFSHARECFEFAKSAGLFQEEEFEEDEFGEGIPSPERFQQFIELIERGDAPGGCQSKRECESYCRDSAHFEECIAFGEKMGFIGPEEAAMARRTGGVGPGGCNSHQSCAAYCNDPANQEKCFRFAEEHGLIPEEELRHAKEGFVRLRQGLENAPPEVHACLKSVLGPNIIEEIQAGNLVPGPAIGERVRVCFEKFGHESDPRRAFDDAPPGVITCLENKLGVDTFNSIRRGEAFPTPEMGDVFRVCFEQKFQRFPPPDQGFLPPPGAHPGEGVLSILKDLPFEVVSCVKSTLGFDLLERAERGEVSRSTVDERIRACFEKLRSGGLLPLPKPLPIDQLPTRNGIVCIQVITLAHDPATGVCRNFPTPCDVPPGWLKGCTSVVFPVEPTPLPTLTAEPVCPTEFVAEVIRLPACAENVSGLKCKELIRTKLIGPYPNCGYERLLESAVEATGQISPQ